MTTQNANHIQPTSVIKRSGEVADFNLDKIIEAIFKSMHEAAEGSTEDATAVGQAVYTQLSQKLQSNPNYQPDVETIQDMVEAELMHQDFTAAAKAYILYRDKRAQQRRLYGEIPSHVQALAAESKQYFADNPMGEFVYLRTYARWVKEEQRRETWVETVDRYMDFMRENIGTALDDTEYEEVRTAILKQDIMPSMRLMQFAGDPARRCNTCAYNCSFIAPTTLRDFAEIMYLSMQGCGVGFTVESENVEQLPQIARQTGHVNETIVVADSKEGWCDALTSALTTWYAGQDVDFDFSAIRPAGSRLHTMGGKASGPEPLRQLLEFTRERIFTRQGRRLRPLDVHDIICKIGECVVAGGVRRTAMISLSDLDDADLRDAKKGQFYLTDPHRMVANNSAVYEEVPSNTELMEEWTALMKSGSGERGIFNRACLASTMPQRRKDVWQKAGYMAADGRVQIPVGTNPCGEIILQSKQFCNLSEIIARAGDTKDELLRKARLATLVGTYQSTLINFQYISKDWQQNSIDERLLGVSITGQWDCDTVRTPEVLAAIRDTAIATNAEYAKRFAINQSASVTAVKPSGTVSQTFNCSSGIHPRHAAYYVRRIRVSATDAIFQLLKDQGVPYYPEVGQHTENATTYVLEFPVQAPGGSTFKDDVSALEQLEYWKMVKLQYTEHNPSATISVGENEWIGVLAWVHKNWDIIGGLSFLPRFDHVYQLAPYETISEAEYKKRMSTFPTIDYAKLLHYEHTDTTEQKRELACAGGTCEIDMPEPPPESK